VVLRRFIALLDVDQMDQGILFVQQRADHVRNHVTGASNHLMRSRIEIAEQRLERGHALLEMSLALVDDAAPLRRPGAPGLLNLPHGLNRRVDRRCGRSMLSHHFRRHRRQGRHIAARRNVVDLLDTQRAKHGDLFLVANLESVEQEGMIDPAGEPDIHADLQSVERDHLFRRIHGAVSCWKWLIVA
jgi:hypothetical protein